MKRHEEEKKVATINENGSILNRNIPGMSNLFKVLKESAMKKSEDMLKQEDDEQEGPEEKPVLTTVASEDVGHDSDTPPPMERLGDFDEQENQSVFDQWPLYSNKAIDFKESCELLIGIQEIDDEKVCKTIPLQFKHEGTFLIASRQIRDINKDDNGGWGE